MWIRASALALLVAACHDAPQSTQRAESVPVLRVLYRDANASMLLTLPARKRGPMPPPGCRTPLLIDPLTGAVHAISDSEAASRLKTMQMAGATPGTCPPGPSYRGANL
ncbi:MAG: hypothetical protein B7Z39_01010 [Novosphingobium sp. 12-64-8]|nr:MAG: hypothetical protein B7Z39_01010 [Novosphingobium sp. 12-64-8]